MNSVIKTNYVLNLFDNSLTDNDRNAFMEDTDEEERFIVYISTVADMIKHFYHYRLNYYQISLIHNLS